LPSTTEPAHKGPSKDKSRRLEFLDVLRGFAAMSVFVQHSVERVSHSFAIWASRAVNFGEMGVVVFFIASGFIIPVSIEKYGSIAWFWLGRVLRLWPVYLLSLLAVILVDAWMPELNAIRYFHSRPAVFVLGNLTMMEEFLHIPYGIGVYWTLSLELSFYAVCSLLFQIGMLKKYRQWLAIALLGQLASVSGAAILFHRSLPAGRIGLLVSCFFGTLVFREMNGNHHRKVIALFLPATFAVFAITFWVRFDLYNPRGDGELVVGTVCVMMSWAAAYAIFLLFYALRSREFPRVLIWIGQISYPLYLFHGLVIWTMPRSLSGPLFVVSSLAVSLAVAHILHVLVENPIARFQRKVIPKPRIVS
jgi:peptidoglycan/LPS O-acetylase OafA/YrhL